MSWSIADVARITKVTPRTLRHYDAIGLLPPAWTADGGRRYYERDDLRERPAQLRPKPRAHTGRL